MRVKVRRGKGWRKEGVCSGCETLMPFNHKVNTKVSVALKLPEILFKFQLLSIAFEMYSLKCTLK
jgi:hypothetical protein